MRRQELYELITMDLDLGDRGQEFGCFDDEMYLVIPFDHEVPEEILISLQKRGYEAYVEISQRGQQIVVTSLVQ